jgi:hypothetical protein
MSTPPISAAYPITLPQSHSGGADVVIFPNSTQLDNITFRTCSSYVSKFEKSPTVDAFLDGFGFNALYDNLQAGNTNLLKNGVTQQTAGSMIPSYIARSMNDVVSFGFVTNCVTEGAEPEEILINVNKAQEELELSKDRYDFIHSPETHVSNFEGTFPIYRPVKQQTLFVLFGAGMFFMLLALLFFLRTQGVQINILMPQSTIGVPGILYKYTGEIVVASLLGIGAGYFYKAYISP